MSSSRSTLTNKQAGQLFSEIANSAEAINWQWVHLPVDQDDPEALYAFINQMRRAVMQIGWIADKGAGGCGVMQVRGDAENWMLSPLTNDTLKPVTTEEPS